MYRPFSLLIPLLLPLPGLAENMTVAQILAQGCTATPSNFSLNSEWNNRMQVIASFCNYPSITQADVNGLRKPKAFVTGSPENQHDRWGAAILAGDGAPPLPEDLGIAPNTDIVFGEYCTDAAPLQTEAQNGDVIFTMRAWAESCAFLNPDFKTIPIVGIDNEHRFIGDTRLDDRILVTFGSNYGQAIDYFTTGSRRISYTTPEFAGIVVALNSALIESNHPPLTMQNIKNVLDDSSDEVYLEVGGYRNVYKEYQVDSLMQDPANKYFGQVINLANAIDNVVNTATGLPRLTLNNEVENLHGGVATAEAFTLSANSIEFVRGIPQDVVPGTYDLEALGVPGYRVVSWTCSGGYQEDENSISLSFNQNASCTALLEDIAPELTIYKAVRNENGGSADPVDFKLRLIGGDLPWAPARVSGEVIEVDAHVFYRLSEDAMEGYSKLGTACTDDITGSPVAHPVSLSEGQRVSCTITNIDIGEAPCTLFVLSPGPQGGVVFCL